MYPHRRSLPRRSLLTRVRPLIRETTRRPRARTLYSFAAGRSCRVGRTSRREPSKYLFCVVPEHASRCPTKTSSPWSADRVFHRTSLDGASSEAPRSTAGVVLSETTPWTNKENKRDLILLPSRFGETSTRFRRETRRGNESTGSRLGARDMPHEGAGRHAVVLGRFDRAFSMPTTEKTLVARLNFTCSRRGTAQKRFTHPYHDHLTRFLPLPPPPSHT